MALDVHVCVPLCALQGRQQGDHVAGGLDAHAPRLRARCVRRVWVATGAMASLLLAGIPHPPDPPLQGSPPAGDAEGSLTLTAPCVSTALAKLPAYDRGPGRFTGGGKQGAACMRLQIRRCCPTKCGCLRSATNWCSPCHMLPPARQPLPEVHLPRMVPRVGDDREPAPRVMTRARLRHSPAWAARGAIASLRHGKLKLAMRREREMRFDELTGVSCPS